MTRATYLTLDTKGRTTLPEEVREDLGVGPGDFILLDRTDRGTYELVPAALVPKDQLWFYHPEMQARVADAEDDLRAGRFMTLETPEATETHLDSLKRKQNRRRRRGTRGSK
jgi:AbrB family looped-hinge helix DNA binding protein